MENKRISWGFIARVLAKATILFLLMNLIFAWTLPLEELGRISVYNSIFPGRSRLPYGENPAVAYNLSLNNIAAMFSSHELRQPKLADEYRVILLGDSNTWGWLQPANETLAAQLNVAGLEMDDGRRVTFYNLGYPIIALSKDLLLLDAVMDSDPDLIIWMVTLDAFPVAKQMVPPLVQQNPVRMRMLIRDYDLALEENNAQFVVPGGIERTIVGQRRVLADWLRLQLLAVPWATTGIDQEIPPVYDLRRSDFTTDVSWGDYDAPAQLREADLALDILAAGIGRAEDVPVWIVNEPIFIAGGENSELHYNAFYPRWVYDQYRIILAETAVVRGWRYLDLWDRLSPAEFTDTPVHLTAVGTGQLAAEIEKGIFDD